MQNDLNLQKRASAEKKNFIKLCVSDMLYAAATMFCSGAVIQSYLLTLGFSEWEVYVYSAMAQAGQVAVMLLMIFFSSRIVRQKLWMSVSSLSPILSAVTYVLAVAFPDIVNEWYVIAVYAVALISSSGVGMRSVLYYSVPLLALRAEEYGRFAAITTALSGVSGFVFSFLHSFVASFVEYKLLTAIACLVSVGLIIMAAYATLSVRELYDRAEKHDTPPTKSMLAVFRNRDTYLLIIPNFARGLASGIVAVITVIAISAELITPKETSYINVISYASLFLGSVLFAALYKKLSVRLMIAIPTVAMAVLLPLSVVFGTWEFLILIFATITFKSIIDTAIPTMIVEIIPEEQIGAYTSIRMLLFIGPQAIAALLVTPISSAVGYVGLLIFAAAMQLICGAGYFAVSLMHRSDSVSVK